MSFFRSRPGCWDPGSARNADIGAAGHLASSALPSPGEGHLNQAVLDACAEPRLARCCWSAHDFSAPQREGTSMPRTDNAGLPALFDLAFMAWPGQVAADIRQCVDPVAPAEHEQRHP